MKVVLPLLCLVVVIGVLYGLAFVGVLPAQKWADANPKLAPILRAAHLAKAAKPKSAALVAKKPAKAYAAPPVAVPPVAPIAAPAPVAASLPAAPPSLPPDTHGKLDAIYAAMSADDLAHIFEKLSDPEVIKSLMPMDEKKAGQVLAAMPAERAARLSRRMMESPTLTASNTSTPVTSLP